MEQVNEVMAKAHQETEHEYRVVNTPALQPPRMPATTRVPAREGQPAPGSKERYLAHSFAATLQTYEKIPAAMMPF